MIFRLAETSDIPQLINLRIDYLKEDFGNLSDKEEKEIVNQLEGFLRENLNRSLYVFVCEDDKNIVSCVFLQKNEVPANHEYLNGKYGTIMNVYTIPSYRRRGIAQTLLEMAVEKARKENLSALNLKASPMGYPLYKKIGFVDDCLRCKPMVYKL